MKTLLPIIICLLLNNVLYSQSVNGIVTDQLKKPIIGVQILNLSNGFHTHSDEEGNYMLKEVAQGDTLQLTHIGFLSKNEVVTSLSTNIKTVLKTRTISLEEIVISPAVNEINIITEIDLQTSPVNSSQDVLRQVPGLFIGQHAGGGKAEQIFLRGFDIDHGTDIAITVDGMPVNMVSHAHGQGYADLHFVIPETIDNIDFGKGPYYANIGNFNTAGYVNFKTKENLDNSSIKVEAGQFDTYRTLGQFKLLDNNNQNAYLSAEFLSTDGPFDSPQNFNRINLFGKYSGKVSSNDKIGVTLSHFTSRWDASGQIPQRSVDDGTIDRFGAIDDTEGGNTSRTNLLLNYDKYIDEVSSIKSYAYVSRYDFELFSNFTFFLEDSINGDQIRQKEDRIIYGLGTEYSRSFSIADVKGQFQLGMDLRHDESRDNELSRTLNRRETLEQIQLGDINETNLSGYANAVFNFGKWSVNPGVRVDYFDFQYNDELLLNYRTQSATRAIVSPKLNVSYQYSTDFKLYLKGGTGFHSNDTRVSVAQQVGEVLPAAYGADAGFLWKPFPRFLVNAAYWYLFLEQEFVYVGDAGIVEPSGKTQRQGVDVSLRYQPLSWLFLDFDANYTLARSIEEESGQDFIPLAPDLTMVGGLNVLHPIGIYGGANVRYIKDRPANEDNSIVAEGYTVVDLNAGYQVGRFDFGFQIINLLNTDWNETQFATESRLVNEAVPVEEIHFTPGTPFFIKGIFEYNF